jgi:hypothetical protein
MGASVGCRECEVVLVDAGVVVLLGDVGVLGAGGSTAGTA